MATCHPLGTAGGSGGDVSGSGVASGYRRWL